MAATQQFQYNPNTIAPNLEKAAKLQAEAQNVKTESESKLDGLELITTTNQAAGQILDPYIKQKALADAHVGSIDAYNFMASIQNKPYHEQVDLYRQKFGDLGKNENKAYVQGFQSKIDTGYSQALRGMEADYKQSVLDSVKTTAQSIISTSEISPDVPNPKIEDVIENIHQTTGIDRKELRDAVYLGFQEDYAIRMSNAKTAAELTGLKQELDSYNKMYFSGTQFRGSKSQATANMVAAGERQINNVFNGKLKIFQQEARTQITQLELNGYKTPLELIPKETWNLAYPNPSERMKAQNRYAENHTKQFIIDDFMNRNTPTTRQGEVPKGAEPGWEVVTAQEALNAYSNGDAQTLNTITRLNSEKRYMDKIGMAIYQDYTSKVINGDAKTQAEFYANFNIINNKPGGSRSLIQTLGKDKYTEIIAVQGLSTAFGGDYKLAYEAYQKGKNGPQRPMSIDFKKIVTKNDMKLGSVGRIYSEMMQTLYNIDPEMAMDKADEIAEALHDTQKEVAGVRVNTMMAPDLIEEKSVRETEGEREEFLNGIKEMVATNTGQEIGSVDYLPDGTAVFNNPMGIPVAVLNMDSLIEFDNQTYIKSKEEAADNRWWITGKIEQIPRYVGEVVDEVKSEFGKIATVGRYLLDKFTPDDYTWAWAKLDKEPKVSTLSDDQQRGIIQVKQKQKAAKTEASDMNITAILKREGGYQAHPQDKGNYLNGELIGTKYGITPKTYQLYYGKKPTANDIKNLSMDEAYKIYKKLYWDKYKIGDMPKQIQRVAMQMVVMSPKYALEAVNKFPTDPIKAVEYFLSGIKKRNPEGYATFGKGWTNRLYEEARQ